MVPMFKIFLLFLLLLLLAACNGNGQIQPPIIEDTPEEINEYEIPDIPQHNTYIVSLDINPEKRTAEGISRIIFTNRSGKPMTQIVLRSFLNAF